MQDVVHEGQGKMASGQLSKAESKEGNAELSKMETV